MGWIERAGLCRSMLPSDVLQSRLVENQRTLGQCLGDALELARRSDVLVMTVQSTAEGLQPAYDRT